MVSALVPRSALHRLRSLRFCASDCSAVAEKRSVALLQCLFRGKESSQHCASRRSAHCLKTFYESYDFANRTLSMLLGCSEELVEWGPPLGPPLDEWYKCAGCRGQPFCPGIPSRATLPEAVRDTGQNISAKTPLLR